MKPNIGQAQNDSQPAPSRMEYVARFLISRTGLKYLESRPDELDRKVLVRMDSLGISAEVEYLAYLQDGVTGKKEFELLVKELTVGETYFFRHREQFEATKKILPELFAKKGGKDVLRVWSAGCSNGAELYSLSILLQESFAAQIAGHPPCLIGTDLNSDSLAKAMEGIYEDWSLRGVSDLEREKYFDNAMQRWKIKDSYRQGVHFEFHNLAADPIPSASQNLFGFDLIFLRNVLIYFDAKSLNSFLGKVSEALVEGGYLAVAPAEVGPDFENWFEPVTFPGGLLYRKKGPSNTVQASQPAKSKKAAPPQPKSPFPKSLRAAAKNSAATLDSVMEGANQGKLSESRTLLESMILKDSLNHEVLYYLGLVNHNLGETQQARENLTRVLYLNPDFFLASFHLGLLFFEEGKHDEARKIWEMTRESLLNRGQDEVLYAREQLTVGNLLGMVDSALNREKENG